jgi:RNA polymerase sigma factor (sigma-70 family)
LVAVPSIGRASEVTPRRAAPEADATRDLYERYARQIYSYCLHQLGNREEAEDATQSTFLNAFRGFQRGVDPEFESAWLYKIAQNVCLTRQRTSSRRRRVETPGDLEAMQDYVPAPQADSDELIRLPEALDAMPEQQRRALVLREWQGLSYKEIGEELELSQAAVETLLFRARRSLAAGLSEEPAKKPGVAKRLRASGDLGSILAIVKSLVITGGTKVAVSVATVAATSVVAATPATRHAVEDVVTPGRDRHAQVQQHATANVPAASNRASGVTAPFSLVPTGVSKAATRVRNTPLATAASKQRAFMVRARNALAGPGFSPGFTRRIVEPSASIAAPVVPVEESPAAAPPADAPHVDAFAPTAAATPPLAAQPAATQPVTAPSPPAEKPKEADKSKGEPGGNSAAPASTPKKDDSKKDDSKKDDSHSGQGTSNGGERSTASSGTTSSGTKSATPPATQSSAAAPPATPGKKDDAPTSGQATTRWSDGKDKEKDSNKADNNNTKNDNGGYDKSPRKVVIATSSTAVQPKTLATTTTPTTTTTTPTTTTPTTTTFTTTTTTTGKTIPPPATTTPTTTTTAKTTTTTTSTPTTAAAPPPPAPTTSVAQAPPSGRGDRPPEGHRADGKGDYRDGGRRK